jgi:hypothetical protein
MEHEEDYATLKSSGALLSLNATTYQPSYAHISLSEEAARS